MLLCDFASLIRLSIILWPPTPASGTLNKRSYQVARSRWRLDYNIASTHASIECSTVGQAEKRDHPDRGSERNESRPLFYKHLISATGGGHFLSNILSSLPTATGVRHAFWRVVSCEAFDQLQTRKLLANRERGPLQVNQRGAVR